MSMESITAQMVRAALIAVGGPTYELTSTIADRVRKTNTDIADSEDLAISRLETERQENEMRRLEAQARVAQEMAIASRINTAGEVQIEEFYEYAGDGKAGFGMDEKGLTIGASGSGKRVSKRVYKFTGAIPLSDLPSFEAVDTQSASDDTQR